MDHAIEAEHALARMIVVRGTTIPDEVRRLAAEHLVDLVGVSLAGAGTELVRTLASTLLPLPACTPGAVRSLSGAWLQPRDAVLLDAVAGHVHDFDDDDGDLSLAHPTVTILTAACIAAQLRPSGGAQVLDAYVSGVELIMRLGPMVNPGHYNQGFHATATLGAIGAAVSAGLVLGLSAPQMRHAIGAACSLGAGLRSNFGSDVKPLQAGLAAGNGLFAAQLARAGLSSTPGSLFGSLGFAAVHGASAGPDGLLRAYGTPWGFAQPGITIKAYPCCTCTHTAVDSLLAKWQEGMAGDIAAMDVWVDPAAPRILIHDQADTALEGKFSMPFCLAAAAIHGRLGLAEFTEPVVRHPDVRALMARIRVHPDATLPKGGGGLSLASRLRVTMQDGRVIETECAQPSGSAGKRLDRAALRAKFLACSVPPLLPDAAAALFEALMQAPSAPDMARLLGQARPAAGPNQANALSSAA